MAKIYGASLFILLLFCGQARTADLHWQGGAPGKETAWEEAGNWSEGKAPGPDDNVVFDNQARADCLVSADARVKNFTVSGGFAKAVSQAGKMTITGDCNIAPEKGLNNGGNRVEIQGNIVAAQSGQWMKGIYGDGEIVHNIVDGKSRILSGSFDGLTISGSANHIVNTHTSIHGNSPRGLVISDTRGCKLTTSNWFTIGKDVTIGGKEGGELDMRDTSICLGLVKWNRGPKGVLTLNENSHLRRWGSTQFAVVVPDEPWTSIYLSWEGVLKLSSDLTSGSLVTIGDDLGHAGAVLDCQNRSFKTKMVTLRGGNTIINGGILTIGELIYEKTQNKETKSTTGTIQGKSITAENVTVTDGTLACQGPLTVTGTLDIAYGATLDMGNNDLVVKGEMNVGGNIVCTGKITKPE
ncbi:MAG: hypothetical protein V2A65_09710 [Candidatus Omnitrophota bacterium]